MVAFVERRANPETNSFCQKLLVMDVKGGGPREIDRGGELLRAVFSSFGWAGLRAGFAAVVAPRWSPDGRAIAYLKRINGSTQVWVVDLAAAKATQVTRLPSDIDDFAWAADGTALIVAHRPGLIDARLAIEREGRIGFLFDKRFSPMQQHRPLPVEPIATVYERLDLNTGLRTPASPEEMAIVEPLRQTGRPAAASVFAATPLGDQIWSARAKPDNILSAETLSRVDAGRKTVFELPRSTRIVALWWSERPGEAYIQTREGWGSSQAALYRWRRGSAKPALVLRTSDVLAGCERAGHVLLCAREGATSPRTIVRVDMDRGRERRLYDPNPVFAQLKLGHTRRFTFLNAFNVECYATLVLPPDHKAGQVHPLVLVQYIDDGFLRGGLGDEVPIQPLAAAGFAVLSFERPMFVPAARDATSPTEQMRLNRVQWVDRRSVESALEIAVKLAIDTGNVDPARMGISGLSDGTSTTQWALLNSHLFSVAALGGCCEGQVTLPLNAGPAYERFLRDANYPAFDADAKSFWAPLSLAQNADRIDTPILIQTSDTEYGMGLDAIAALRERSKPLEVRIFPDEVHFKWQPEHRLAIYDRNLRWFRFWLMNKMDCREEFREERERWTNMVAPALRGRLHC